MIIIIIYQSLIRELVVVVCYSYSSSSWQGSNNDNIYKSIIIHELKRKGKKGPTGI